MIDGKPISNDRLDADEPNQALRASIDELKSAPLGETDWKRVDDALFARIGRKAPASQKSNVLWFGAAATLAAAAAVAMWLGSNGKDDSNVARSTLASDSKQVVASSYVERRGEGDISVSGASVLTGRDIFASDHVVATGASAVFERPNKVRWLLESGSAVSVERAEGPLVLALERGATEAQVVPVPNGEAFAIDVTSGKGNVVRIAVHGTHLRVARVGDHVTVDLTEGVISVGAPPKRGSTLGELVTAPAHVDLDIDSIASGGALDVHHDATSVRTAVSLSAPTASENVSGNLSENLSANEPNLLKPETPVKQAFPLIAPTPATAKPATTGGIAPNPDASALVALTVRSSVRAEAARHSNAVTVIPPTAVVVEMDLDADGYAHNVTFHPPLPPDVQSSVANVLYDPKQTRFAPPTTDSNKHVRVEVDLTR